MKAVILCAGYGTRAYPLTINRAKALLPVRNKPIIEFIVKKVQLLKEVDEIFVVTNHRFYGDFKRWQESFFSRIPIEIVDDGSTTLKNKLGAIKDLVFVIEKEEIDDDLLVIGGDNLFDFSLSEFIDFAKEKEFKSLIGVYALNGRLKPTKFGIVKLNEERKVVGFYEKPAKLNGSRIISTCIYFFPKEKLSLIKEYIEKGYDTDKIGSYIEWLTKRDEVYGYEFNGTWIDIGDIDSYTQAVFMF
ncbi:MAG: nucleotidyltransferase family protein [Candidatus Omnitrophota bacterium]|nr:MAG: nucleotidyltransferase family protein [Candidatus Omnitrophota bacterium]